MKENNEKNVLNEKRDKKSNWQIIIPIIVAIVVVAVFIYLDYKRQPGPIEESNEGQQSEEYKPKPISPSENPRREEQLSPELGCAGPSNIEPDVIKKPSVEWLIDKNGETTTASLGKYKITAPINLIFDIPRLWLYFFSEKLSDREDKIYGLEKSYTSRIVLVVNGFEREIRLGGDKYMFIELSDYPLGDLYPHDKETILEFEFLIELKCKKMENGTCLSNEDNSLGYINNADIQAQIRIFAVGCQEFTNDILIDSVLLYN